MKPPLQLTGELLRNPGAAARLAGGLLFGEYCHACGRRTLREEANYFGRELCDAWGLSGEEERYFNLREAGLCRRCGACRRAGQLAEAISQFAETKLGTPKGASLVTLCGIESFRQLRVAEVNAAGQLHGHLKRLRNLAYSEYQSKDPAVPDEDILALSYADASFDLALTSETLEHIPDIHRALAELYRVLAPGGAHICTVPVLLDRQTTVQRASVVDGQVVHWLPPSYHGDQEGRHSDYLAFYEYGADFASFGEAAGFRVETVQDSKNPTLVCYTMHKQ